MRKISKIILHCTATPEGKDFTVAQIREWHVKGTGWSDIGYHFVIDRYGVVHKGRPIERIGAHTTGQNANSIGIAYVGGITNDGKKTPKDTRTPAQRVAIVQLVKELKAQFGQNVTVHGHNEFAAKACPSFKVKDDPELSKL